MPNLPYRTTTWNSHVKTGRLIRFPLVRDLSVLEVQFTYEGPLATYAAVALSSLEPDYLATGKNLYLNTQSDLENIGGGSIRYTRTWRSIPPDQVTYGSQYITKPDFTPTAAFNPFDVASGLAVSKGIATLWTTWADNGACSYSATNGLYTIGDGAVYNPVKAITSQVVGVASAGTFTLTYGASTTAGLAWNASAATIIAALNALADVVSAGITFALSDNNLAYVGGGQLQFSVTGGTAAARQVPVLMTAASLTVNTSTHTSTAVIGSSLQNVTLATHLSSSSHGLSGSLAMAGVLVNGTTTFTFVYSTGNWGVVDANTLWVPNYGNGLYGWQLAGTFSATLILDSASTYQGGSRLVRIRRTVKSYLPGVTPGITTPADITVPAGLQNPNTFLAALLTPLTGYQVYQSEGPEPWLEGPVVIVTITEVYFPDLV